MLFQEWLSERRRKKMNVSHGEAEQGIDTKINETVVPLANIQTGITCVNCGMRLKFQQPQHNE